MSTNTSWYVWPLCSALRLFSLIASPGLGEAGSLGQDAEERGGLEEGQDSRDSQGGVSCFEAWKARQLTSLAAWNDVSSEAAGSRPSASFLLQLRSSPNAFPSSSFDAAWERVAFVAEPKAMTDRSASPPSPNVNLADACVAVWTNLLSRAELYLQLRRKEQEELAIRRRQTERQRTVGPFFIKLRRKLAKVDSLAATTFPPSRVFLYFDSVKPFWESDTVVLDKGSWRAARPAILEEARTLAFKIKHAVFTHLLAAHSSALSFSPTLSLPPLPSFSSPPTLSEIDTFLALPTSLLRCGHDCSAAGRYPGIIKHLSSECRLARHEYSLAELDSFSNAFAAPVLRWGAVERDELLNDIVVTAGSVVGAHSMWDSMGERRREDDVLEDCDLGFECTARLDSRAPSSRCRAS